MLLDAGADVNAGALQIAAFGGQEKIVQLLLDEGADVNANWGAEYSKTALTCAITAGQENIVSILLDAGADMNAGALHTAASFWGNEMIVQLLLDAGADVNAQWEGRAALQAAMDEGHEGIVQILLDAGADVSTGALHTAAASLREIPKMVQLLLNAGADVNAQWKGKTALQEAIEQGHKSIVQMLLDTGGVDAGTLHAAVASYYGEEQLAQIVLDAGADVNGQLEMENLHRTLLQRVVESIRERLERSREEKERSKEEEERLVRERLKRLREKQERSIRA